MIKSSQFNEDLSLSIDAISDLFKFNNTDDSNKQYEVNVLLQIYKKEYNGAYNETFYTLRDLTYHYSNFLIYSKHPSPQQQQKNINELLQENDIIHISSLSAYHDYQINNKVFIINSYKIQGRPIFNTFNQTKEYNPNEEDPRKVFVKNEPFSYNYSMLNHITSFSSLMILYIKVQLKTALIKYKNKHGFFFYFDVIDNEKTELRIIGINSNAEYFYPMIKTNSFYQIKGNFSRHRTEIDTSYNNPKNLDLIYLANDTEIIEITNPVTFLDDRKEYHTIQYVLTAIPNIIVNVIGKVLSIGKCIVNQNNKTVLRKMTIGDSSGYMVDVALWNHYVLYPIKEGDVVELFDMKLKKIGYNNNANLNTHFETKIVLNGKGNEVSSLKKNGLNSKKDYKDTVILDENDCQMKIEGLTCIDQETETHQIKSNGKGFQYSTYMYDNKEDKKDNGQNGKVVENQANKVQMNNHLSQVNKTVTIIKGTLTSINHSHNNYYTGCIDLSCKGIALEKDKVWICQKCNLPSNSSNYYYTMHATIKDCTGAIELVLIDNCPYELLQINAQEYHDSLIQFGNDSLDCLTMPILFNTYLFHITNFTPGLIKVNHIEEINYYHESRELLQKIKKSSSLTSASLSDLGFQF